MRIAICDDEIKFADNLKAVIQDFYKEIDLMIDVYYNGADLLAQFEKRHDAYHIVLLDIEMEPLDGMTLAKRLEAARRHVMIIFLTSHRELAADGYEVSAFRFITKPLKSDKLFGALEVAQKQIVEQHILVVEDHGKEVFLKIADISYAEARDKYVCIYAGGKQYSIRKSIGELDGDLKEYGFFRTHRSYLVHLSAVRSVEKDIVCLDHEGRAYISRRSEKAFRNALMQYVRMHAW